MYWLLFGISFLLIVLIIIRKRLRTEPEINIVRDKGLDRIAPLLERLRGEEITRNDVMPYAKNQLSREITFQVLKGHKKEHLFPAEYYFFEKAAESNLCNWLEKSRDFSSCPEEIIHLQRVEFEDDGNLIFYEVFKFRTGTDHWMSQKGWMIGVVGSYSSETKPYDFPAATYSRFLSVDESSADKEVRWVHENINK